MSNSKLTVLVPARWPVGGIRSYIRYLYTRLGDSVGRLILVGPQGNGLAALGTSIDNMSVSVIETQPNLREFGMEILRALRREKVDVLHSQGYITGAIASPLAKFFRVPHVVTVHDVFHGRTAQGFKSACARFALGATLRWADVLQPVGMDVQENIAQFLPLVRRGPRIHTIRNGIDIERLAGDEARDLRAELGIPGNVAIVGFMGRFMAQKGFRVLVDAVGLLASQHPQLDFRVVAFGEGGYLQQDRADIERRGLGRLFHFLPFVTNVGPTLRGLDVLTIPSRWEACPLLPMEALVGGVPVIGTNCIGMREVLADSPARQLPPGDAPALAEAIRQELLSPGGAAAKQFRSTAAARFSIDDTAAAMQELLLDLAGMQSRPR